MEKKSSTHARIETGTPLTHADFFFGKSERREKGQYYIEANSLCDNYTTTAYKYIYHSALE